MVDLASSLLAVCIILLSAFGVGRPLWRLLADSHGSFSTIVVWSISLGLLVLGEACALFGFTGWLTPPILGIISFVASLWGLGELMCYLLAWRYAKVLRRYTSPRPCDEGASSLGVGSGLPNSVFRMVVMIAAGCVMVATLLSALSPPVADEVLCGRLQVAKNILLAGQIEATPLEPAAAGPLVSEMWYVWALALDGPVAAGLLNWTLGILLAMAAGRLATLVLGRGWTWVIAALVIVTPGIAFQMATPRGDLSMALFATLSTIAWWQAVIEVRGQHWFWICGLALGGALTASTTAVVFIPTIGIVWLGMYLRHVEQREQLLDGWIALSVTIIATAGFWYARCWWLGGTAMASPARDGNLQQLGPLLLAAAPMVIICRRLRGLPILLLIAGIYVSACLAFCPRTNWWPPLVPLLAVAVGWVSIELARFPKLPRQLTQAVWAVAVLATAAHQLATVPGHAAVALAWQSREDYLRERQASYGAALVANRLVKPGAKLLSQDPQGLYFNCHSTDESLYRAMTAYHTQFSKPGDVSRCLKAAGFSHILLIDEAAKESRVNSLLNRMIDAQLADPSNSGVLQLVDYRFTDADCATKRYRLLMLR